MRTYYDADARKLIDIGLQAASDLHRSNPSEHTTQVLLTLGYMHGLILAMDDELAAYREAASGGK